MSNYSSVGFRLRWCDDVGDTKIFEVLELCGGRVKLMLD